MSDEMSFQLMAFAYRVPMLAAVLVGLVLLLGAARGPGKPLGLAGLAAMLVSELVAALVVFMQMAGAWTTIGSVLSILNGLLTVSSAVGLLLVLVALRQALQASRAARPAAPPRR